jgi:thioredoxin-like negative regulator of GroEL
MSHTFPVRTHPKTPLELAKIIKNSKCVLIKFGASWCGPCQNREFLNNLGLIEKEFARYHKDIKIIILDVDDDAEVVNSTEYYDFKINSIPQFKFCYDGSIIKEYNGIHCLNEILENLTKVASIIDAENANNANNTNTIKTAKTSNTGK